MNRKIVFRAWDVENNKMIQSYAHVSKYGQFYTAWTSTDSEREYIPMQYTGLKDKNGKEIFEGDIICNNNANWEVGFDEGGYWMRQQEGQHKFIFINEAQHSEVIGNLYENPELLDNK